MFTVFGFVDNNTAFPEETFETLEDAQKSFAIKTFSCVEVNLWEGFKVIESFNKPPF